MSSDLAKQYHSINIGEKNTWDDWHLIPTSRPFVTLPTVNEKVVEIPGRNGVVDLTSFLTGSPTYGNRKGSWEFYISTDYHYYTDPEFNDKKSFEWNVHKSGTNRLWSSWSAAYRNIAHYCNGQVLTIILDDDPGYSYEGRLKVAYTPDAAYSKITISYDLGPQKIRISDNTPLFD